MNPLDLLSDYLRKVERRLRLRALGTTIEQRMAEGSWFRVSDHRTPEGDSIAVFSEITQFKEREAQLIDLAEQKGRRGAEGKQGA